MQLSLDQNDSDYSIDAYEQGLITINKQDYQQPVIVSAKQLLLDCLPPSFHDLDTMYMSQLAELDSELVIIGCGREQHFLPPSLLVPLYNKRIGVEVMTSNAACRTFNVLMSEQRNAIAAIFP